MIRKCQAGDTPRIYFIINEAARAYDGVIPADRYHQPYMSMGELEKEMRRMTFFGWETGGEIIGVIGIEPVNDVTLIRHTYVLPEWQNRKIGGRLLSHLKTLVTTPRLLVGTWADAHRAVAFYRNHGFHLMPDKDRLLETYWDIPRRQVETSVVLGLNIRDETKESP